jgi:hypothetical protein
MAHKIGWSCFPKINGAELESLSAPNMEVLLAQKKLGKDMGRANFLLPSFFLVILHRAFTLSFVVSFLPFF